MMHFHKIKNVNPMENYILKVIFEDDSTKYYDVSILFEKIKAFRIFLVDKELFKQVKVDIGGYGISWNDDIDLACDELWENGYIKK